MREEEAWYAIQVKPKHEKRVALMLEHKGYERFLPSYKVKRKYSGSIRRMVELPLFPGYLFCRLDIRTRLPVLQIPGVRHFVSINGKPAPVDSTEIESVRRCVETISTAGPWPFIAAGSKVRLDGGPLQGIEGILVSSKDDCRLVVSVTLLCRSVAVVIKRDWVAGMPLSGGSFDRERPAA